MKREAHPRGRVTRPLRVSLPAPRSPSARCCRRLSASRRLRRRARPDPALRRRPVRRCAKKASRWQALTPAQREALAPLERDWAGIDAERKQKWLALAARFKTLPPDERARISARMSDWAKLTPAERGQARLRFEEARQLPAPDRSARWQAYQALPPEQQAGARRPRRLGRKRTPATAATTGPHGKRRARRQGSEVQRRAEPGADAGRRARSRRRWCRPAPARRRRSITRKPAPPAHQQTGMPKIATTPEFVNRSTLLPQRGPQAAAVTPASGAAAPRRYRCQCARSPPRHRDERAAGRDRRRVPARPTARRRWCGAWRASSTKRCCCSASALIPGALGAFFLAQTGQQHPLQSHDGAARLRARPLRRLLRLALVDARPDAGDADLAHPPRDRRRHAAVAGPRLARYVACCCAGSAGRR